MFDAIFGIGKFVLEGITDHFKDNRELKKIQTQGRIAHAQGVLKGEHEWDMAMAQGSQNSWKDEYITIIFTIPLILCFIPGMVPFVEAGFAVLATLPEWYQISVGVVVAAAVGVKGVIKTFQKMKN